MRVFNRLKPLSGSKEGRVLAVGNFDGVHRGHQQIFTTAVKRAQGTGLAASLLTFTRHPAALIEPARVPEPLMAVKDRLLILEKFGFDEAFVLKFDDQLASMSPERFVDEILLDLLGVRVIVAGEGWRFGSGRTGNMSLLTSLGRDRGFEVIQVQPYMVDDLPVSSTRIRGALNAGDVQTACALLGRPHFIRGEVVGGMGRGKTLGYPTINLQVSGALVPGDGVYSGGYLLGADTKGNTPGLEKPGRTEGIYRGPAAISIGSSPTFEDGSHGVEAHLIGWESDLYGATVTIAFYQRLRDQHAFSRPDGLADQIALDVAKTRELFSLDDLQEIPL